MVESAPAMKHSECSGLRGQQLGREFLPSSDQLRPEDILRIPWYRPEPVPRDAKDALRPQLVRAWEELTLQLLTA